MSSESSNGPNVPEETIWSSITLNNTLMFSFLMGIYALLYPYTIYVYFTQKKNGSILILGVLSVLFGTVFVSFVLSWLTTYRAFVTNGATRFSVFLFIVSGDRSISLALAGLQYFGYVLADGLLLWRCFHMSKDSMHWMITPVVLYFSEIVLSIASLTADIMVVSKFHHGNPVSVHLANVVNGLNAGVATAVALTSLSATYVIYRKIQASMEFDMPQSRRFMRIVYFLIQSTTIYTFTAVLYALFSLLSVYAGNNFIGQADFYITNVSIMATGIAPTLMVAQLSMFSNTVSSEVVDTVHISAINFHPATTTDSESAIANTSNRTAVLGPESLDREGADDIKDEKLC